MGYYVFQRNVGYTSYSSYTITVCLSTWHGLAFVHFYVGVCVCVSFYSFFFFGGGGGRGGGCWEGGLVKLVQILEYQSFQIHQDWYGLY